MAERRGGRDVEEVGRGGKGGEGRIPDRDGGSSSHDAHDTDQPRSTMPSSSLPSPELRRLPSKLGAEIDAIIVGICADVDKALRRQHEALLAQRGAPAGADAELFASCTRAAVAGVLDATLHAALQARREPRQSPAPAPPLPLRRRRRLPLRRPFPRLPLPVQPHAPPLATPRRAFLSSRSADG
ncbi:hypothetical protein AB1Y20_013459 [Prymnesium parvum]|uniref:Uncharacterized protein n=1 Tax=Prymnesium parvum TaxID=97485 RepID=A0AB34IGQ1_PRYPA